ncbi:MAG: hypothetical protein QOC64_1993 [Solirubrobacteraceae bacterium]|jgi:NADPH2:quinone reductase|nr:hypothetical protein [Solirubrobacteraceae bacterium]
MRAAVLEEVGTIPVFTDFKEPEEGDGRVAAEVLAAGLNPVDLFMAAGRAGPVDVPRVVGLEGVARVGEERGYFNGVPSPFGSMAQFAPIDPSATYPVPADLAPGLAVAIGIAGLAAWVPLETRARLQRGESVLVLGASGVVGQLAVQAAKLLGAGRVVAAARHRPTLEALRERGADEVVELGSGDDAEALKRAAGDGYDVVLDAVYGPVLEAALPATAVGARVVTVGAGAGATATIAIGDLYGRSLMGHGGMTVPDDVRRSAYERMARHALAGELTVDVRRLPLSEIEEAWRVQAQGAHQKLVLVP